jgi:hypothetical protein
MSSRLARLFWEALDRAAYAVTDARLWLFELIHGPEPSTPADEKREQLRQEFSVTDFGTFMAGIDEQPTQDRKRR